MRPAFSNLSGSPQTISSEDFALLERFTVLLYSRTCPSNDVNQARQALFAQGNRTIENIPPTKAALEQHVRRAAYQAGHVWGQTCLVQQNLPCPSDWGWQLGPGGWVPIWSLLPEAAKACHELIHCKCKKACRGLCKCYRANLSCTALCFCGGSCQQPT